MKDKIKKQFINTTDEFLNNTSSRFNEFKQFMFAPFLLTFVISIVIGYSFSAMIKSLTSFLATLVKYIFGWIFNFSGTHSLGPAISSFSGLFDDTLTLFFISLIVFYTIKTINKYLTKNKEQQWGYDQAHEDALKLQALQEQNIKLQKELIAKIDKLDQKK